MKSLADLFGIDPTLANKEQTIEFYEALDSKLSNEATGNYKITTLVNDLIGSGSDPSNLTSILQSAYQDSGAKGMAYRYALLQLLPLVIEADTQEQTSILYDNHNTKGELELYDPSTETGVMTQGYLADRTAFLERVLWFNQNDINPNDPYAEYSSDKHQFQNETKYFHDVATGTVIQQGGRFDNTQYYIFGDLSIENYSAGGTFNGAELADFFYGSSGKDNFNSKGGDDYLDGYHGNDTLEGGNGFDLTDPLI